jgi:hypothetical protein
MKRNQILESDGAFFRSLRLGCDDRHQDCCYCCCETHSWRHIFSPRDIVAASPVESAKRLKITFSFFYSKSVLYGVQRFLWVVDLGAVRELQRQKI